MKKSETKDAGERSASTAVVRTRAAQVVRLVFTLCAALLALGALLIALRDNVNADNAIVRAIIDFGDAIDGPFGRTDGPFAFDGEDGVTSTALANWGVAAVIYLLVGRLLERVIRP
ncbi:hypothetical protein GCM10027425_22230 [Alteromonas gracilis]